MTSNARPTGSITAAPGNSDHASVASSSVAPAGTSGAKSSGCAPGVRQSARPQEQAPPAVLAPGTTSQPHSPVYSATAVHSDERPRRREPDRMSRMPRLLPIVKPMPPPTGPTHRWLRDRRTLTEPWFKWRLRAHRVVRPAARASLCTVPLTPDRPMSSESCEGHREFIRRGGEWWRFRDRHGWTRDRRITLSARHPGAHALVGMPKASRYPVRWVRTGGRAA
jgi:hypothetical protein